MFRLDPETLWYFDYDSVWTILPVGLHWPWSNPVRDLTLQGWNLYIKISKTLFGLRRGV